MEMKFVAALTILIAAFYPSRVSADETTCTEGFPSDETVRDLLRIERDSRDNVDVIWLFPSMRFTCIGILRRLVFQAEMVNMSDSIPLPVVSIWNQDANESSRTYRRMNIPEYSFNIITSEPRKILGEYYPKETLIVSPTNILGIEVNSTSRRFNIQFYEPSSDENLNEPVRSYMMRYSSISNGVFTIPTNDDGREMLPLIRAEINSERGLNGGQIFGIMFAMLIIIAVAVVTGLVLWAWKMKKLSVECCKNFCKELGSFIKRCTVAGMVSMLSCCTTKRNSSTESECSTDSTTPVIQKWKRKPAENKLKISSPHAGYGTSNVAHIEQHYEFQDHNTEEGLGASYAAFDQTGHDNRQQAKTGMSNGLAQHYEVDMGSTDRDPSGVSNKKKGGAGNLYSYTMVPHPYYNSNNTNTADIKPEIYAEVGKSGHPQAQHYEFDESVLPGTLKTNTTQQANLPEEEADGYAGLTISCVGARQGMNVDYTEPAKDEHSLYAQFKALDVLVCVRVAIKLGSCIGSGQFGTVYKGQWRSPGGNVGVAVKTLNKGSDDVDKVRFLQEAAIMGQFQHTNVVKLYGVVTVGEPLMIVLELLPNGDLRQLLLSLRKGTHVKVDCDLPPTLLSYCRQVASGMSYLANKAFVHRDLAARNILVASDGTCKVADFGMSRDLAQEEYYISHGGQIPVKWTAPEAMHFKKYSTASDVWSYGVVMYEIWSIGHKPFENSTNIQALKDVGKGIRMAPPPGCTRAIYEIMIQCWHPITGKRPSFNDIVQQLQSEEKLLKWSVREKASTGLAAMQLGADLEVAKNLHKDLRDTYIHR